MKLTQNTILITGGTSGIGLEMAKQFLKLGNTVLITGRDQAKLEKVKNQFPKLHTFASDVSDAQSIEKLFTKITTEFPDLNVLINNAGIMRTINVHDKVSDLHKITEEIEINLKGPVQMVAKFLPHLQNKPSASIVNVTSGLAFVPMPTSPVYCATKAALHSYTQSLRVQLQKSRVQIFELAPPATKTELLGTFDPEDMKGISIMTVEAMVASALKGLQNNQFEIRPGQSNQLKFMSRLAPNFILAQLSKPVDRMLAGKSAGH